MQAYKVIYKMQDQTKEMEIRTNTDQIDITSYAHGCLKIAYPKMICEIAKVVEDESNGSQKAANCAGATNIACSV